MHTGKPFVLGVAVAICVPPALWAQGTGEQKQTQVWTLQGLGSSYCVRFAIEPHAAARELRNGFRLIPAGRDPTLHSSLKQVIQQQPEFAAWSPSQLCFYFSDAVQVGTRRVAEKNVRNQQMLAVWTIAAQEEKSGARRDLAIEVFSARGPLRRAAEGVGVRLHESNAAVVDSADASNDVYRIKLERTSVIWRGRPTRDSSRVEQPIRETWSLPGLRSGIWSVQFTQQPSWSRPLVGSLMVEGKGDLAKALKASPIRFVGPLYRGGAAELRFSR
jgi:hypothetical protein